VRIAGLVAVLVLVATGCVGTVTRAEFDAEIEARGGGFSQQQVVDAFDAVAAEVGTDEFQITNMYVGPKGGVITLQVRNPRRTDELDTYTLRNGEIVEVSPVRTSAGTDLDAEAFPVTDLAVDELDQIVDDALGVYETTGGFVSSLQVLRMADPEVPGGQAPFILVHLESPRSEAVATFRADGTFFGLERR
jgi:hypothetical protein